MRGEMRNPELGLIKRDFTKLLWPGGITPTDLDGFIDFGGKTFIYFEGKFKGHYPLPGQEWAFERLCRATEKAGIKSVYILVWHEGPPYPEMGIPYDILPVIRYYFRGKWIPEKREIKLKEFIDDFLII